MRAGGGRGGAAAHAGRSYDAHGGRIDARGKFADQGFRAGEHAANRVADPDRQRRRRGLSFFDDIEMIVKGRDLVDLGLRHAHFLRQRRQVRRRQMAERVLQLVQVLDQEVAPARLVVEPSSET